MMTTTNKDIIDRVLPNQVWVTERQTGSFAYKLEDSDVKYTNTEQLIKKLEAMKRPTGAAPGPRIAGSEYAAIYYRDLYHNMTVQAIIEMVSDD